MKPRGNENESAAEVRRDDAENGAGEDRGTARENTDRGGQEVERVRARVRSDHEPEGTDPRVGLWPTLKRTALEFNEDNMPDWAAALTYYGLLSLFPALIALVSIVGLFGDPEGTTQTITDVVTQIGPSSAADTFAGPIQSITSNQSASGILLVVGIAVALWSASAYVGAFIRASNIVWETPEGRGFLKLRPLQLVVTLVMIISLALVALALVLTGPIVQAVGGAIGVGDTALTIWDIAKWPVLLVVVGLMIAILYYAAPNVKVPGFRWITVGGFVALAVWIIASAAFALYVANFGSYDKTYGTLGGIVTLLIWMWISNLALLFGAELNAERERSRELADDVPRAEREIQLEPRDEPDRKRTA
jgi:membrane protein